MKTIKSVFLTILTATLFASVVSAQYDDVYYDPSEDAALNQSGDFEEDYYEENQQIDDYRDGYNPESERYGQPSTTETYYDDEGNTYITNNYNDYSYSSRLRRFYDPMMGFGYYSNFYTDPFFYNYDPFFYGTSIYATTGWWRPRVNINIGWGWGFPGTYYGFYRPFRPVGFFPPYYGFNPWGPGFGFNNGFNNGFYNGYAAGFNDGFFGNPYNPYFCPNTGFSPGYTANGNIYYGPRNGRSGSNYNSGSFSQEALNAKQGKMGTGNNPVKTDHSYNTQQTSNPAPVKGVRSNSDAVKNPDRNDNYVKQRDLNSKSVESRSNNRSYDTKSPTSKEYSNQPKSTPQQSKDRSTIKTPTQRYYVPSGGTKGSKSTNYNKPSAPVRQSTPNYTKPKRTKSNYSKPKSNYNTKPKSFSSPKKNINRSSKRYSSPKSYSAPKSNSWSSPKSSGSRRSYSSPKSNFRSSGSSGRSFTKPSKSFSSPKK